MDRAEAENIVLRALCPPLDDPALRREILDRLGKHSWSAPEYEILFRVLGRLAGPSPGDWELFLVAELTRAGFPDTDLVPLARPARPSHEEIHAALDFLAPPVR